MSSDRATRLHSSETGESAFAVFIDVAGHHLLGDEPLAAGGKNLAPSPYDFLLASLGSCTSMTVRWYARQKNWPLERVDVTLTHRKENIAGETGKRDVFEKTIRLTGDRLTDEQRRKLIEVAAKCPVQRTLEGQPEIRTEYEQP